MGPFTGARGADNPLVFAGFVISNSETGHGSFKIIPQITVQICDNGLTLTQHALKEVHLGGRLATGQIQWVADTERAALDLVVKQTRDAVSAFLDRQFLRARVTDIQAKAGVRIDRPAETLEHVDARSPGLPPAGTGESGSVAPSPTTCGCTTARPGSTYADYSPSARTTSANTWTIA